MEIKRVDCIDALRGFTIFLMVLCAAISWDAGLPAWMFHCQTPPPDYAFHPEVRGLTWVDMVFPLFIFSMGAAIPFALHRKLKEGMSVWSIVLYLFKRCAVLVAFAIVLGNSTIYTNAGFASFSSESPFAAGMFRAILWLMLFMALVRTKRKWINWVGWTAVAGMMVIMHFCLQVPFNISCRDEIIMILAHLSLLGGLLWLADKESFLIRTIVWLIVVAVKIAFVFFPDVLSWASAVSWMQYLVIIIPASMIGDLIKAHRGSVVPSLNRMEKWRLNCAAIVIVGAVVLQFWALFIRLVLPDLVVTALLAAAFFAMTFKNHSVFTQGGNLGFCLLLLGICWDFVDGGLAKEYCNLSYLLVTGGISTLVFCLFGWIDNMDLLSKNLVYQGQNPMIGYTIAWFIITPLLYQSGFLKWFDELSLHSPAMGFCRGLIVCFFTLFFTCLFTRFKIFWRS